MWKLTCGMLVLVGVALVCAPVSAEMLPSSMDVGDPNDEIPDLVLSPGNVLTLDTAGLALTSYIIKSEASIFTGEAPQDTDVPLPLAAMFPPTDADDELSKAFIGGNLGFAGVYYLGQVIGSEFSDVNLFDDLTTTYTYAGATGIGNATLIIIPEPSTLLLLAMGLVGLLVVRRRR